MGGLTSRHGGRRSPVTDLREFPYYLTRGDVGGLASSRRFGNDLSLKFIARPWLGYCPPRHAGWWLSLRRLLGKQAGRITMFR